MICKKSRGLFLFKRNEKKNRKGTPTPKMPFVEHQLPRAYHLNVFPTFLKRKEKAVRFSQLKQKAGSVFLYIIVG